MKILILTCNTGQGHNSAANSIVQHFAEEGIECITADALSFLSPKMSEFISSWHVRIYRYAPVLFGQGYEFAEKHPSVFADNSAMYNFFCLGVKKLEKYIEDGAFDGIICVHVFSALMITELKKNGKINIKTSFVATDYTCSPGVADTNMDAYFIPHENLYGEFVACGVPSKKIIPSGIPVKEAFFSFIDKKAAKKQCGIDENAKHILMMCGSMGCGPMEDLSEQLAKIMPGGAVLTVVCGTNEKLKKHLEHIKNEKVNITGFAENVSALMDSADLYMTKPGGISITEAAFKRLPLAFIDAVPGCESYNRYFFLTRGMAIACNNAEALPELCLERLFDEAALTKQRQIMEREFCKNPAGVICDFYKE